MPLLRCTDMTDALNRKPLRDPRFIESVLANLALMDGVSRHVVRQLSTQSVVVNARRGEVLIRRGEPVRGVHAIAYGSVKKRLWRSASSELVLGLLGAGDTFGEVPALLGATASAEAVALTETMLLVINAACIRSQAVSEPRLAHNLSKALARRLQAVLLEYEIGRASCRERV